MKTWLITATAPIAGCEEHYVAYSEENPETLPHWDDIVKEIIQELWDSYSWCLHLDDEEYETEEEETEAYDQAYEDWKCDCNFSSEEMDLESYNPNEYEIVYDERE